jgi:pantetheine-phosphate adenylyltransferase
MKRVLYAGSFDPPTFGHLDVMQRVSDLFDEVIVGVAENTDKHPLFTVEERVGLLAPHAAELSNVRVESFSTLVVEFARSHDCTALVRGIRTLTDFEYEHAMALANRQLGDVETIFLPSSTKYAFLSSRLIKEAGKFGGEISHFVPRNVEKAFRAKLGQQKD